MGKRRKNVQNIFRTLVVLFLLGGFVYQTMEFLLLYWTYPTVVDIQQSSPFYLDVPAFTFCNRIGYNYSSLCKSFPTIPCASSFFVRAATDVICEQHRHLCDGNKTLPKDFRVIFYGSFMQSYSVTPDDHKILAVPLERYLNCTIEFAGNVTNCNLENVLGSFYTTEELPQYCFTIYSLWGQPGKKREKIPKGSTMKFQIFLNVTQRPMSEYIDPSGWNGPKYNPPSDANVQIAVHSPYFLPSPSFEGTTYLGGRSYELRIKMSERHLLPLPYQTNCTDYMSTWKLRGGKAPISQLSVIQECRLNRTFEALGCIPVTFDYPHNYNICKSCDRFSTCELVEPDNNCTKLSEDFNQPCESITYEVDKQTKAISVFKGIVSKWTQKTDGMVMTIPYHDCSGNKIWSLECCTIDIEIPFDRFEITNITYNAKFESLELFSVIGGYMGMWLGISLLAIFDETSKLIAFAKNFLFKRKHSRRREAKSKFPHHKNKINRNDNLPRYANKVW